MLSAGVGAARYAALKAGVADAALVLPPLNFPGREGGLRHLAFAPDYVKDLPFTGMAVFKPWASAHVDRSSSACWRRPTKHRLVRRYGAPRRGDRASGAEPRTPPKRTQQRATISSAASGYFEPTSKVSRAKLQNLIDEERRAGNIGPTLTVDRLVMPGVTELVD